MVNFWGEESERKYVVKYKLGLKWVPGSKKEDQNFWNKTFKGKILIPKQFHLLFGDMRFS